MENYNIYSPTSSSFVSEPYGLSEFHKWVIPQMIKDNFREVSPTSSSLEDIDRMREIVSQSFYMEDDRMFLADKFKYWRMGYQPSIQDPLKDLVPKPFKKSIYEG